MGKYGKILKTALFICFAAFSLAACGGGSGNSGATTSVPQAAAQSSMVEGIAAAGAPLTGVVSLRDSVFLNYSSDTSKKPVTAPINQDGTFSIDVSGLQAPFILRAADGAGNILYSFAKAPGTVNINPLTNLGVAIAAGATNMQDLDELFVNHNSASMGSIANALTRATADIRSSLQPLLSLYGAETADPLNGNYKVNKQGLDGLFEQVATTISRGTVSITNKGSRAAIFTAPADNITSGAVNTSAMPTPTQYYMPGNAVLTLKVDGSLPQGTLIRNLALSVKLPLGITVDPDPNDSAGLTSVVNTAIPTGAATGANVYPTPTLTATNNTLGITMSSLAGFGAGEFLTIRLIVSSAALMKTTTAASFSITSSSIYADIYKNTKLKKLTITPVSLVYQTREGKSIYDSLCARCHTLDQSDSVITPTLYGKLDLLPDKFKTPHHKVTLTADQLGKLTAYLNAYYLGQKIL